MKKLFMLITILLFSLVLYFGTLIQAKGDPISAAGAQKFQDGTMAPGFIIKDLSGNRVKLADFRGNAVMLIFWTTW